MLRISCLSLIAALVLCATSGCPYFPELQHRSPETGCVMDEIDVWPHIVAYEDEEWPQETFLSSMEEDVFFLINEQRQANGVAPLEFDPCATLVARDHSRNMADNRFFAHNCPEAGTPRDRLNRAGIPWRSYGENIGYTYGFRDAVAAVVAGWMNSPGHRKNILNARYTHAGIGIALDEKGAFYFTQDFLLY